MATISALIGHRPPEGRLARRAHRCAICRRQRYVYIWADGIHLQARLEDEKQCLLVSTPEGRKELVGFTDGARECAHDWRDLLLDLKRRGLDVPRRLTIADGALGEPTDHEPATAAT